MNPIIQLHVSTLKERLQRGEVLQLIDIREDEEIAYGMIPGAKHIPMDQIAERVHEIEPNREVILICRSGYRSEYVCKHLQQLGIQDIVNLQGGMLAWFCPDNQD